MTPLCALSHVPCHDSVRAAYKKPAAISKMAGIMENSGLEDRSTPVISSLAIFLSLSLFPVNLNEPLSLSLSLCLSLLGDSFGGGEYFVKKKERKEKHLDSVEKVGRTEKDVRRRGGGKSRIWKVESGSRLHSGLTSRKREFCRIDKVMK